jgi:TonB family protein
VVSALPDDPYKVGLLSLRTAALLELNQVEATRASARQLFEAGAAKSEGPTLRQFIATIERQGWLTQGGGAPAAAQSPAAATPAPAAPAAATPPATAAAADPNSLAGSVWSGTLVALNRNRKEVARYDMDIHFKEGGDGKAIYRELNPALAWTQSGTRAVVKMELIAGCVLSLELVSGDGTLNGVGSWSKIPGDAACAKAAGAVTSGATFLTRQTAVPSEFSATRIAFAPKSLRPVISKPADAPRSDPVAVTRVAPVYPPKAEKLSLEGWVVVVFTVAADGSVKDAKVRESTSNLFDEAAVSAVSQWRYKPITTKKGVATERPGVSVIITFKSPE